MSKQQSFFDKILQGMSLGIVVALIPGALLGELMKALIDIFPFANQIIQMTKLSATMLPICIGFCIAVKFEFGPIEASSVSIAALIGSGIAIFNESGVFILSGTGDIINTTITAILAIIIILFIGKKIKPSYMILIIPVVVVAVAGGIGLLLLPYIKMITKFIGFVISFFTTLQPLLMCVLTAISFSYICVSPISSVGIALAIQLSGIAAGAANLGCTASAIGLAIAGYKVNGLGTTIAHFLGSPKIQMSNFLKNPLICLPISFNAAILGVLAYIFQIKGTPFSAGFGISGLIGPLAAFNLFENNASIFHVFIIIICFFVAPFFLSILFNIIFIKKLKWLSIKEYKVEF